MLMVMMTMMTTHLHNKVVDTKRWNWAENRNGQPIKLRVQRQIAAIDAGGKKRRSIFRALDRMSSAVTLAGVLGHPEATSVFRQSLNGKRSGKIVAAFPADSTGVLRQSPRFAAAEKKKKTRLNNKVRTGETD